MYTRAAYKNNTFGVRKAMRRLSSVLMAVVRLDCVNGSNVNMQCIDEGLTLFQSNNLQYISTIFVEIS